jgi:phospholipase C
MPASHLHHQITRRSLLKAAAAGLLVSDLSLKASQALAAPRACGQLKDIEHVVILIQENRSFDHYFGTYRGVAGFAEPRHRVRGTSSVFLQRDSQNTTDPPSGFLLPFHLDTKTEPADCTPDLTHSWAPQHQSWNEGRMDQFAAVHLAHDVDGRLTMGYYDRSDLALHYAVADAFTLCDHYFCSVLGPTDPNRLYSISATLDPAGRNGGPLLETVPLGQRGALTGRFTWTTMPEQLEQRGISWKIYTGLGAVFDNVLTFFKRFQDPGSALYKKARTPRFPNDFLADLQSGSLPQVSWILSGLLSTEHPPTPPQLGEARLRQVITALAGSSAWPSTALFYTYDENGGFFDHMAPPTPPPGTPGEFVTAPPVPDPSVLGSPPITGPIGLGFRVPMLVISPFSRGGFVSSDVFDHTSLLLFLERRFGAEVPNLSGWRRATVGDLTSAFNFGQPDTSVPTLPTVLPSDPSVLAECSWILTGKPPVLPLPNPQALPSQEPGNPRRPKPGC